MEAAGLVLGAIPIAIWALEKYQEPLEAFCDYDRTIRTLKADLVIQKERLDQSLHGVGVHNAPPEEAKERLRAKFPRIHGDLLVIITEMNESTFKLLKKLKVDVSHKPNWKEESSSRASWEWRRVERSVGIKRQKAIIDELRKRNFDIQMVVEKPEVPTLNVGWDGGEDDDAGGSQRIREVQKRNNPIACDAVRDKARSLHRIIQAGIVACGGDRHEATIELDWEAAPRFSVSLLHSQHGDGNGQGDIWKFFYASREEPRQPSNGRQPEHLAATMLSEPLRPPTRSPSPGRKVKSMIDRALGRTAGKSVSFATTETAAQEGEEALTLSLTPSTATMTATISCPEITNLCTEIPSPTQEADPFATIKDPHTPDSTKSFSLSHTASQQPAIIRPVCLKRATAGEDWNEHGLLKLSAGKRYTLAVAVAKAVLYLSNSPWLSDGWITDRVRLFLCGDSSSGQGALSSCAHIFSAFSPSAPGSNDSLLPAPARFIPNKTIFALGILLIELGENKSFEESSLSAVLQGDYSSLFEKLENVSREAGAWYRTAAQTCVFCTFMGHNSRPSFEISGFRRQFYDSVVAPLQATVDITSPMYRYV
jgi:hypothetical protein